MRPNVASSRELSGPGDRGHCALIGMIVGCDASKALVDIHARARGHQFASYDLQTSRMIDGTAINIIHSVSPRRRWPRPSSPAYEPSATSGMSGSVTCSSTISASASCPETAVARAVSYRERSSRSVYSGEIVSTVA